MGSNKKRELCMSIPSNFKEMRENLLQCIKEKERNSQKQNENNNNKKEAHTQEIFCKNNKSLPGNSE